MGSGLPVYNEPYRLANEVDEAGFLRRLGGPAILAFNGDDNTRSRVVVTLLHGNEPSGVKALLRLANEHFTPRVTTYFVIASTNAALTPPEFTYRMLPGHDDLNRCFNGMGHAPQVELAKAIKDAILAYRPEAVIDLHNTSGKGPDFCVSTQASANHTALASHFSRSMIVTDIRLGSLMEQALGCPVVTVEAGGAKDSGADDNAYYGLRSFLSADNALVPCRDVTLLTHPRRLELVKGKTVSYANRHGGSSLTLRPDIERYNVDVTPAGTVLGFVNGAIDDTLVLDSSRHHIASYFDVINRALVTKLDLRLFMITTKVDIAQSDCLFYFVEA